MNGARGIRQLLDNVFNENAVYLMLLIANTVSSLNPSADADFVPSVAVRTFSTKRLRAPLLAVATVKI
jgi:hypothetical protein